MQDYFPTVYPKMFDGKYGGIAVGKGWFNILNMMCRNIQSHIDWKPEVPQVKVLQVKEKFGTLRFYYEGGDEYIHGLTSMAEAMSEVTCEDCGVPGTLRQDGWMHVTCDPCEDSRQERRLLREGFEQ